MDDETLPAQTSASEPSSRRRRYDRPLERGDAVGRYLVLDRLGAGGMGVVYTAYDPELDRRIALKLLAPALESTGATAGRARLVREAQAMARVTHPNVVTVHDVGEHDGQVFVAMELVDGDTLTAWRSASVRTWSDELAVMRAAGRGLAAAHAKGLVHRDFKPDNVMVARDGRVLVMDFGLARAQGEAGGSTSPFEALVHEDNSALSVELTRQGAIMGTPAYMAPEQHLGGETDARSDQFSFCVALYEGLWRARPFEARRSPRWRPTSSRVHRPRPPSIRFQLGFARRCSGVSQPIESNVGPRWTICSPSSSHARAPGTGGSSDRVRPSSRPRSESERGSLTLACVARARAC